MKSDFRVSAELKIASSSTPCYDKIINSSNIGSNGNLALIYLEEKEYGIFTDEHFIPVIDADSTGERDFAGGQTGFPWDAGEGG